jgi:hypothetical protein
MPSLRSWPTWHLSTRFKEKSNVPAWYYMLWLVVSVACTFIGAAVHSVLGCCLEHGLGGSIPTPVLGKARDAGR